jgi:hypothetical protein
MRPIEVELEYCCPACGHRVAARLRCSGRGLAAGPHTVAAVRVSCLTCDGTSLVYFEPCGRLRAVEPCQGPHEALVSSLN